jgi:hypothetical protein
MTFSTTLAASGLLTEDQLQQRLKQFRERYEGQEDELVSFVDFLIGANDLTRWQADKLLKGMHKGFYVDNYVLLSQISGPFPQAMFKARDIKTGAIVSLEVHIPSITSPVKDITYRVVSNTPNW